MADQKKSHVHPQLAEKLVKLLPAKVKAEAEIDSKAAAYSIIRVNGRSIASVRDRAVRIVHPTDGSADSLKALAKLVSDAAPEAKPEPKPKAKAPAKPKADAKPEGDDDGGSGE